MRGVRPFILLTLFMAACGARDPSETQSQTPDGNAQTSEPEGRANEMPEDSDYETYEGVIVAYDGTLQRVKYRKVGDLAVVGGDMIIGTHEEMQQRIAILNDLQDNDLTSEGNSEQRDAVSKLSPRAKARGETVLGPSYVGTVIKILGWGTLDPTWPGRTVGYEFDSSIPEGPWRNNIRAGIARWNAEAPINLVPAVQLDPAIRARQVPLVFVDHKDPDHRMSCMSWIGYHPKNGRQEVYLNPTCLPGNVEHELGHAVGLHHEHQRPDRAVYLKVNSAIPDDASNYGVLKGRPLSPHDLCSIMHYRAGLTDPPWFTLTPVGANALQACVANLRKDCHPVDPSKAVGQRCQLSPTDVASLNALYKTP
jgi:hypothetical protein